jgi:hypothetical protein
MTAKLLMRAWRLRQQPRRERAYILPDMLGSLTPTAMSGERQ